MHPAHTLPQSTVNMGVGLTQSFPESYSKELVARTRQSAQPGGTPITEEDFFEGALVAAALPTDLSAVVAGRVGLGGNYEAGLTATGRAVRVDGRRSFEDGQLALSVGLGAAALYRLGEAKPGTETTMIGRFEGDASDYGAGGIGLDLPILVGWRNRSGLVNVWAGGRGGYERMWGNMNLSAAGTGAPTVASVASDRWFGGALLGASMGFEPIWVHLEVEATYQGVSGAAEFPDGAGTPERVSTELGIWSVTPSAAIVGKF